jgi:hypothetical protein
MKICDFFFLFETIRGKSVMRLGEMRCDENKKKKKKVCDETSGKIRQGCAKA